MRCSHWSVWSDGTYLYICPYSRHTVAHRRGAKWGSNVWNDESQTTAADNLKKDLNAVIPLWCNNLCYEKKKKFLFKHCTQLKISAWGLTDNFNYEARLTTDGERDTGAGSKLDPSHHFRSDTQEHVAEERVTVPTCSLGILQLKQELES